MEYVTGGSLRDRLARGPIPLAKALDIARAILEVLVFAHAKGIVHRDLKPENILFDDRGRVKVCDFGLGKVLASQATSLLLSGAQTTSAGRIVGTPAYMSPEQLAGLPSDPRNDLFSWGVILYEMLLGKRPSEFGHVVKWPTTANVPGATAELDRLLQRSLCEAGERFQTAAEALCAIEALTPHAGPGDAGPVPSWRVVWRRLHSKYIEWLLDNVRPSEALIAVAGTPLGRRVRGVEIGRLVANGCVSGTICSEGELLALLSIDGLVTAGEFDLVSGWVEQHGYLWGPKYRRFLSNLAVDHDRHTLLADSRESTARALDHQGRGGIWPAVGLSVLGLRDEAFNRLEDVTSLNWGSSG